MKNYFARALLAVFVFAHVSETILKAQSLPLTAHFAGWQKGSGTGQAPKPGTTPSFNTPFGYFVEAYPSDLMLITTYYWLGVPFMGRPTPGSPNAPYERQSLGTNERFVLLRFYKSDDGTAEFTYSDVQLLGDDGKRFKPIAHISANETVLSQSGGRSGESSTGSDEGLLKNPFVGDTVVVEGGSVKAFKAGVGDTYWAFRLPKELLRFEFHYKETSVKVKLNELTPKPAVK